MMPCASLSSKQKRRLSDTLEHHGTSTLNTLLYALMFMFFADFAYHFINREDSLICPERNCALQVVPSDEELQRKAQMRPQMETFRETLVEAEIRISVLDYYLSICCVYLSMLYISRVSIDRSYNYY